MGKQMSSPLGKKPLEKAPFGEPLTKEEAARRRQNVKDFAQGVKKAAKSVKDWATSEETKKKAKNLVEGAKKAGRAVKGAIDGVKDALSLVKTFINDKSWYTHYSLEGMVNLNFGRRRGIIEQGLGVLHGGNIDDMSVPLVAQVLTMQTIPNDESKAWMQGINYIYSMLRQVNGTTLNFSQKDLSDYFCHLRGVYAAYAVMRRAFAALNTWNVYDSSIPVSLFAALGLDYDSWRNAAGEIRTSANLWAIQISNLMPGKLDLFDRDKWLYSSLFTDSNDAKASYIVVVPDRILTHNGTLTYQPLCSASLTSTTTGTTWSSFRSTFAAIVNNFMKNSTFADIAGVIIKAYGTEAVVPAEVWDDTMRLQPVYSEEVLTQLQNATVIGDAFSNATVDTTVDYGVSKVGLARITASTNPCQLLYQRLRTPFVNTYKDTMDAGDTIVATRLMPTITATELTAIMASSTAVSTAIHCGTEIVLKYNIYHRDEVSTYYDKLALVDAGGMCTVLSTSLDKELGARIYSWSGIDWSPFVIFYVDGSDVTIGPMWDFNNYARPSAEDLDSFNAYATLSLLYTDRLIRQQKSELYNNSIVVR